MQLAPAVLPEEVPRATILVVVLEPLSFFNVCGVRGGDRFTSWSRLSPSGVISYAQAKNRASGNPRIRKKASRELTQAGRLRAGAMTSPAFMISQPTMIAGRPPSAVAARRVPTNGTVHVNDVKASREHAKIIADGPRFHLVDLNSTNGTFVNEERIQTGVPVEFKDGDEVRFGLVKTVFRAS